MVGNDCIWLSGQPYCRKWSVKSQEVIPPLTLGSGLDQIRVKVRVTCRVMFRIRVRVRVRVNQFLSDDLGIELWLTVV